MGLPGPRDLYDRFERSATPLANNLTHSEEFTHAMTIARGLKNSARSELNRLIAQVWHTVNLPAGTDVQRLNFQVGALDREIRLLTLELSKERKGGVRSSGVPSASKEHDRPGTS